MSDCTTVQIIHQIMRKIHKQTFTQSKHLTGNDNTGNQCVYKKGSYYLQTNSDGPLSVFYWFNHYSMPNKVRIRNLLIVIYYMLCSFVVIFSHKTFPLQTAHTQEIGLILPSVFLISYAEGFCFSPLILLNFVVSFV